MVLNVSWPLIRTERLHIADATVLLISMVPEDIRGEQQPIILQGCCTKKFPLFFFPQARNCYEKIVEIEPERRKMVNGKEKV